MNIVSYNPGHDGAVAHLNGGRLVSSIEAEKDSNYRYMPIASHDLLDAFGRLEEFPDVVCTGGWWPREARPTGSPSHVGYRGVEISGITVKHRRLIGRTIPYFSSSHERSHLLCGFGMSPFPQGSPCYALIWEGAIGAFYEIDQDMNITLLADVMNQPGNRYASIYGLADPTFPKNAPFSRFSDAGKLMALASFSRRSTATEEEEDLMDFLLSSHDVRLAPLAPAPSANRHPSTPLAALPQRQGDAHAPLAACSERSGADQPLGTGQTAPAQRPRTTPPCPSGARYPRFRQRTPLRQRHRSTPRTREGESPASDRPRCGTHSLASRARPAGAVPTVRTLEARQEPRSRVGKDHGYMRSRGHDT